MKMKELANVLPFFLISTAQKSKIKYYINLLHLNIYYVLSRYKFYY